MRSARGGLLEHGSGLGVEAVAFVTAQADHAFAAQALEHLSHAQERQRDVQLLQLRMHATHTNAAATAAGGVQGVDDLKADQAGAQAVGAQQLADLLVANAFFLGGGGLTGRRLRR